MKRILFILVFSLIAIACKVRKESVISDADVEFLFSHNDCYYYRIFTEEETIVFSDCDEKITNYAVGKVLSDRDLKKMNREYWEMKPFIDSLNLVK